MAKLDLIEALDKMGIRSADLPEESNKSKAPTKKKKSTTTQGGVPKPKIIIEYKCTCCGTAYRSQRNNFSTSRSPLYDGNDGYLTVCKECFEKYYQDLVEFFNGNERYATERICQLFDLFFSDDAFEVAQKNAIGKMKIGVYLSRINMNYITNQGTTYLDTLRVRGQIISDTLRPDRRYVFEGEEGELDKNAEDIIIISKDTVKFFGDTGYSEEDYLYLEEQYADWTTRYECANKVQEELFKNLCITQLLVQQAKARGNAKEISDAMKTFQDLLGTANLKPSQTNIDALAEENTFGTLIKKWENEKPIPEPEDEFKDVDGIKKYILVWFFGHLCKIFKIKNKWSKMYEEEIAEYTVKIPEFEEDDVASFEGIFGSDERNDSKSSIFDDLGGG